jgi:hypothetical protein
MHEEEMVVAIMAILALFGFGWTLVRYCHLTLKAWYDAALKRDMVARGYSAQEIVAVVTSDRRCKSRSIFCEVPPAKPIRQPAYQ